MDSAVVESTVSPRIVGIKELVDSGLITDHVPSLYVRAANDRPCPGEEVADELPVIDLVDLVADPIDNQRRAKVVEEIGRACDEWGFFQIVNHGIPPAVVDGLRQAALKFFQQPAEERMRYYTEELRVPVRFSTSFNPADEDYRDWRDVLVFNRFPGEFDGFAVAPEIVWAPLQDYIGRMEKLANMLYKALFESLGLLKEYMEGEVPAIPRALMTMNYYPPCPDPTLTLGLSRHSDISGITILYPSEVPGLQIRKDEKWVTVKPLKDALVINLGDQTEILTNGRYRSIEHRVLTNAGKERVSIGSFFGPTEDTIVGPLPKLVDEKNPPRFVPTLFRDYVARHHARRLQPNKGSLNLAR